MQLAVLGGAWLGDAWLVLGCAAWWDAWGVGGGGVGGGGVGGGSWRSWRREGRGIREMDCVQITVFYQSKWRGRSSRVAFGGSSGTLTD